ncbi:alkaline phosphatase family protein [Nigerium massiliense]|uniref:alkaline phosphatase family protein n=1 Tax=Nigerium massiliense TaxID=1522317 RepID=UPI0006946A96|nr:nucleotide pyrophosphatase/phosphodiesterase family protein [Nigerium massiliense]
MSEPLLPRYGSSTLAELVPSIASGWGLGWEDTLGLPASDRWVVMMVDGLGESLLAERAEHAPYLASLLSRRKLTCGVPSTTATSLTSLGSALTPGQHGIAGYTFRHPFAPERLLNALAWESGLSGLDVQPRLTALERLAKTGVAVSMVAPARFAGTGLTDASMRGARFAPVPDERDEDQRVRSGVAAATEGERALVYFYERELDHVGHGRGWRSDAWTDTLARVDALAARLRAELPGDVRLVVTGDHGMVDVAPADQVLVDDEPELLAGVDLLGGEGRLRQLYTREPGAVARRWADRFGEDAWVRTRDEAIAEGWFGEVAARLAPRFGDVLVAMAGGGAVMTRQQPQEFSLIGMHGSLTPAEVRVALLVD